MKISIVITCQSSGRSGLSLSTKLSSLVFGMLAIRRAVLR